MNILMLRAVAVVTLVLAVSLVPTVDHSTAAAASIGPKAYYLALGDSLAYGYQPDLDWVHGYADDLFTHLQPRGTTHFVNLACPGETSTSFITGGCPYWYLRKALYLGSQLHAALAVIRLHPAQVSPVTIDLGANDFLPLVNTSTCTVAPTYASALATFDANFRSILAQLSSALQGTGDLVTMNYYDPYQNQCASNPQILTLLQTLNAHIQSDASAYGVPVADVLDAFGGAATPNPSLCSDTWMCSRFHDVHATTAGYSVAASAFEASLGY